MSYGFSLVFEKEDLEKIGFQREERRYIVGTFGDQRLLC